jgi:hypothetical protein
MLALNRSLLNREYIRINVLKALATIICMCNLHVILLSNNTPRYFTCTSQGEGYITTNSQSVSMSWCLAQSRTIDQSLLSS